MGKGLGGELTGCALIVIEIWINHCIQGGNFKKMHTHLMLTFLLSSNYFLIFFTVVG